MNHHDPSGTEEWSATDELEALYLSLERDEQDDVGATAGELLQILGREEVRLVLLELALESDTQLYSDLEKSLDLSSTVLAERLQELTEIGLLDRTSYDGVSPKTEYRVTEKTRDLYPVILEAHKWAMHHEL